MNFKLHQNQISEIAQMLYLNLKDIQDYIANHPNEDENFDNQENNNSSSIWHQYIDDTICTLNMHNERW